MKNKKGFSLVELLVVLIIIGVLIGLILPNALKAIKDANSRDAAATLRTLDTAGILCYSELRDWTNCKSKANLISGKYLDATAVPNDPFGGTYPDLADGNDTDGWKTVKTGYFPNWPSLIGFKKP